LENGCLQGNQPPSMQRLDLWLRAHIQVPSRPDWFFVKLHTHGCNQLNQAVLLEEPMIQFHQSLAERARRDPNFHFHYVTAREMFNLVKAAEAGWIGSVSEVLDYQLVWNGASSHSGVRKPPERARPEESIGTGQVEKPALQPGLLQPSRC